MGSSSWVIELLTAPEMGPERGRNVRLRCQCHDRQEGRRGLEDVVACKILRCRTEWDRRLKHLQSNFTPFTDRFKGYAAVNLHRHY
jgi:hypothetical protein